MKTGRDFELTGSDLFGRYCRIEMFRYGTDNEHYLHKVVKQYKSNTYCDVPIVCNPKPVAHPPLEGDFPDSLEDVIGVITCGIDETEVFPVALKDVELIPSRLESENDELRKELEQWRRLTANIALPEYPACEFQPKDLERENAKLRELARDAYATLLFYVGKYNEAEASLCAEYGEDDAIAKLDRECDNDVMLLERRMKLMGIEVGQ